MSLYVTLINLQQSEKKVDVTMKYARINVINIIVFQVLPIKVWEHCTNDQTGLVEPSPQSVAFSSLPSEQSLIMLQVIDCEMHSG